MKRFVSVLLVCALLAGAVPALAVGLLLRRPAARAGRWVERRLERTRVM